MNSGKSTRGYLVDVKETNSISGAVTFEYDVEYSVDGRLTKKIFVNSPESLGFKEGDSLTVWYSSANPEISLLDPQLSGFKETLFALIFCLNAIVIFILVLFNIIRGKNDKDAIE